MATSSNFNIFKFFWAPPLKCKMFGRVLIEEMIVVDDRFSLEKKMAFWKFEPGQKLILILRILFKLWLCRDGVKTGILKPATYD